MRRSTIRPLEASDFADYLDLMRHLVGEIDVLDGEEGQGMFQNMLDHPGTEIIGAEADDRIRSVATVHILANLTFSGRPYAFVENVVTDPEWRGQGLAEQVMRDVERRSWDANAYKIMLLTGVKLGARGFYEKLGYSGDSKHGMILRRAPDRQPKS